MVEPHPGGEEAEILINLARVQRLLPRAKHAAVHAKDGKARARAHEAVKTLERSLQILKRRQAQLRQLAPKPDSTPIAARAAAESSPTPKTGKAKTADRTARCPVCTQVVPASKTGRILVHRLSSGPKCSEGVEPHVDGQQRPKAQGKPDKVSRQTAWAMQHASSAGLPGLGKHR